MTQENKATPSLCGFCQRPITERNSGIRHFGYFIAHQESDCRIYLQLELAALQAENERLNAQAKAAMETIDRYEAENERLREELEKAKVPQPCCQRYDMCYYACAPRASHWQARAESAEARLAEARSIIASLRRDLADPPGDVQEAVLRKLGILAVPQKTEK